MSVVVEGQEYKIRVMEMADPIFTHQSFSGVIGAKERDNVFGDHEKEDSEESDESEDDFPEDFSGEEDERSSDESVVRESNFEEQLLEDCKAQLDGREESSESKPQLWKDSNEKEDTPAVLKNVLENLKILLSKDTPIKERLEKLSNKDHHLWINGNNGENEVKTHRGKEKTPMFERQITISQKRHAWKQQGRVQDSIGDSSEGIDSSISVGISNRMEEIGIMCGLEKPKAKGKSKKLGGLKGEKNGN
ncbi:hypothetical protein L1887_17597 [Cichorium endivia]|nr:hypothetical protein L1887_17597 [Cichorium endivia]